MGRDGGVGGEEMWGCRGQEKGTRGGSVSGGEGTSDNTSEHDCNTFALSTMRGTELEAWSWRLLPLPPA